MTASTSSTGQREASHSSTGLIAFFSHHGAWAPGVKLFRALQFRAKALIISLVFCIPVAVLSWSFFGDKAASVNFSAKERDGVAYLREVLPLAKLALQQRSAAAHAAVTGKEGAELNEARTAVAAQTKKLEAVDQRLGSGLETAKAMAKLRETAGRASQAGGKFQPVYEAQSAYLSAINGLAAQIVDSSNLALDPDLDTFYLMAGALMNMPELIDSVGQLHSLNSAVANGLTPSVELTRAMAAAETTGDLTEGRLSAALDKVETAHPEFKSKFKSEAVIKALHTMHDTLASGTADAAQIDKMCHAVADGFVSLQSKMTDELDGLLEARVSALATQRNSTAMAVVLALALGAYLFYSFFLVTHGGLREVQKHLEAMTAGDLTTRPNPWGKDEAAILMGTLADMQTSLRKIVSSVRSSSESLVHASTEISSASLDLSQRTEQTAANLQQSASSMEEISSTVSHTADNVIKAAEVASSNSKAASRGGSVIDQVVTTMQDIHKSSSKISEIIGTIDGIAFQTNILALNAAVEAARAGEQGRGFAVVAGEVRSLAQRSASAAKEIKALITGSVELVASGTKVVKGAGETMQELVGNAQRMHDLLSDISTAANEQSQGIMQVGGAVNDLDRMTQQNAALVEQTAAAAEALKDQAVDLAAEVAQFKLPA